MRGDTCPRPARFHTFRAGRFFAISESTNERGRGNLRSPRPCSRLGVYERTVAYFHLPRRLATSHLSIATIPPTQTYGKSSVGIPSRLAANMAFLMQDCRFSAQPRE